MQGRSLRDGTVTQEITDQSRIYRLLGSDKYVDPIRFCLLFVCSILIDPILKIPLQSRCTLESLKLSRRKYWWWRSQFTCPNRPRSHLLISIQLFPLLVCLLSFSFLLKIRKFLETSWSNQVDQLMICSTSYCTYIYVESSREIGWTMYIP